MYSTGNILSHPSNVSVDIQSPRNALEPRQQQVGSGMSRVALGQDHLSLAAKALRDVATTGVAMLHENLVKRIRLVWCSEKENVVGLVFGCHPICVSRE